MPVQQQQPPSGTDAMSHLIKPSLAGCMRSPKWYLYLQVCVPIDPETAEQFDPVDGVPTVAELLTELDKQALAAQSALVGLSSLAACCDWQLRLMAECCL